MAPFKSLDTVSYSHSIATVATSLAVLTQYTNVTDGHPATARRQRLCLCTASRGKKNRAVCANMFMPQWYGIRQVAPACNKLTFYYR